MTVDWYTLSNLGEDIKEYSERRYKDYCRDKNENSSTSGDEAQRERHNYIKDELIKLGLVLHKKLGFFLPESRKELFEQAISVHERIDIYFKGKYDEFCKDLDKTNNALPLHKQKDPYTLHCEKSEKGEQLFERKEIIKNNRFIERIDKRKAEYEKRKAEEEAKKKAEEEEEAKRNLLNERRQGHSNIKPLSFYGEIFNSDDVKYDNEQIEEEQELDTYFQENGKPNGVWKKYKKDNPLDAREYWRGDASFTDKETDRYVLADNPDDNQKYINRCKEIAKIIVSLKDSEYTNRFKLYQIEIFQKYLSEGYLVTRQISCFADDINFLLIRKLSTDPNAPSNALRKNSSEEYETNIYSNDYNITQIKEDVAEFVRLNEGMILTSFEYLKVHLKKHDNRITIKEYAKLIDESEYIASKTLKKFEADKKLKSKKEYQGLNVFYA